MAVARAVAVAPWQLARSAPIETMADDEILALSLMGLSDKLRRGELKAVDVLAAYVKRATVVHHATNAITCFVSTARAEAAAADAHLAATGQPLGPLHGVPVTTEAGPKILSGMRGHACGGMQNRVLPAQKTVENVSIEMRRADDITV